MARKNIIRQGLHPYHVTARCINKEWFNLPMPIVWEICSNYLFFIHHAYNFKIHSFVLMNNHFHALITTPEANLSEGMNYFMREVSRSITKLSGRINQTWGSPYFWSITDSYSYYMNAYKYVYRNPIEAGLSKSCQDYKYSSLNFLLGDNRATFPVEEDTLIFDPMLNTSNIEWLNNGKKEDFELIKQALSKKYFRFGKTKNNKPVRNDDFIF